MSSAGARPVCRRAPRPPPRAAARTRAPHRRRSRPSARQTTPRPRRASSLRASRAAARSRRRAGRRRAGRIGLDIGERAPGHGVPEAYRRAGKGSAGEREHAVVGMAGGACARDAGMHTRRARHTLPRRVAILISFSRHLNRLAALAPATAALLTAGLLAAGRLIRLDPHGFELLAARGHRRARRGARLRGARGEGLAPGGHGNERTGAAGARSASTAPPSAAARGAEDTLGDHFGRARLWRLAQCIVRTALTFYLKRQSA